MNTNELTRLPLDNLWTVLGERAQAVRMAKQLLATCCPSHRAYHRVGLEQAEGRKIEVEAEITRRAEAA